MLFNLGANQAETKSAQGKFVMVEAATGDVVVVATFVSGKQDAVKLRARDQARFDEEFNAIRVMDISGAPNVVEIETGFAQLIARQDGGPVQITGQAVPLDVSAAPVTVEFAAPPAVTINGGVNATINAPVEVFTDPLAPLLVDHASIVETEENAPNAIVNGGAQVPGTGAGYTIVANPDRVYAMLRCNSANNGGPMFVNSVPLYPNDPPMRIDGNMAINVVGSDADDIFYFFEVNRV